MIDVSISDDYAILITNNYRFYYGYEYNFEEDIYGDTREIWGFEVNGNNEKIFRISADEMSKIKDCPNKWDCEKMLLFGIGLFFNKLPENLESEVN